MIIQLHLHNLMAASKELRSIQGCGMTVHSSSVCTGLMALAMNIITALDMDIGAEGGWSWLDIKVEHQARNIIG